MIPETLCFCEKICAFGIERQLDGRKRLSDGNGMSVKERYQEAEVFSLDYEGRGVARVDGKTVFIGGALPGERVTFAIHKRKKAVCRSSGRNGLKPSSDALNQLVAILIHVVAVRSQHVSFGAASLH